MSFHPVRDIEESGIVPGAVTSVSAQVRRPDRVSVHLDGSYAFSIPAELVVLFGIRKGLILDDRSSVALRRANAVYDAKRKALDLLSVRSRSVGELRRALARRESDETVIDEVILRIEELGYLDDEAFARSYVSARVRARGYGPRRILSELRRRGIPEGLARTAIAEHLDDSDPLEAALAAAEKVWPRYAREPDPQKRRSRFYGYLARRGFETDTIMSVLRRLDSDAT